MQAADSPRGRQGGGAEMGAPVTLQWTQVGQVSPLTEVGKGAHHCHCDLSRDILRSRWKQTHVMLEVPRGHVWLQV